MTYHMRLVLFYLAVRNEGQMADDTVFTQQKFNVQKIATDLGLMVNLTNFALNALAGARLIEFLSETEVVLYPAGMDQLKQMNLPPFGWPSGLFGIR